MNTHDPHSNYPVDWSVTERGGKLQIGSGDLGAPDYPLPVEVGQVIHVGCHRITKEAWEILKKEIEEKL